MKVLKWTCCSKLVKETDLYILAQSLKEMRILFLLHLHKKLEREVINACSTLAEPSQKQLTICQIQKLIRSECQLHQVIRPLKYHHQQIQTQLRKAARLVSKVQD